MVQHPSFQLLRNYEIMETVHGQKNFRLRYVNNKPCCPRPDRAAYFLSRTDVVTFTFIIWRGFLLTERKKRAIIYLTKRLI